MSETRRVTPTLVEIDLGALRRNFDRLRRRVGKGPKVMAVVKSNAYGHGAVPVARTLQESGADYFGVGTVDEGIELRKGGIRKPVVVLLGLIEGKFPELLKYRLTPVLYDFGVAARLQQFLKRRGERLDIHIKVDTGMTRLGLQPGEAPVFLERLRRFGNLRPAGLMTHLADADDERFSGGQQRRFETVRADFQKKFPAGLLHVANSLASIDRRYTEYDLVRFGIALYGAYPVARQQRVVTLEPVMHWKSRIISVKKVPKGTAVSYGRRYIVRRASRIGVVPAGYADGYPRLLSNRSAVLVRGTRVPVVGTICMDMMMIDLTKLPAAQTGDEAVLLGRQRREKIRAEELGKLAETISYEIFCGVAERIPRSYCDSGRS